MLGRLSHVYLSACLPGVILGRGVRRLARVCRAHKLRVSDGYAENGAAEARREYVSCARRARSRGPDRGAGIGPRSIRGCDIARLRARGGPSGVPQVEMMASAAVLESFSPWGGARVERLGPGENHVRSGKGGWL